MKNTIIFVFYLSLVLIIFPVSAQDDEPYYNNREAYKNNLGDIYTLRIATSLCRPFYRDNNANIEYVFHEGYSVLVGFGVFLPHTYSLKMESFEDKINIQVDKPGARLLIRGYNYIGTSLDAPYGAFEFAYNSLAGTKFLELGMCFGGVIQIFEHMNIAPEVGFGARKFTNPGQNVVNSNFPVPYLIADVTLGYNF